MSDPDLSPVESAIDFVHTLMHEAFTCGAYCQGGYLTSKATELVAARDEAIAGPLLARIAELEKHYTVLVMAALPESNLDGCIVQLSAEQVLGLAVDEINALRARIEELEEALQPFGNVREAQRKFEAVRELLAANGCDCVCDHSGEEHDTDCIRCLACRVEMILSGGGVGSAGTDTTDDVHCNRCGDPISGEVFEVCGKCFPGLHPSFVGPRSWERRNGDAPRPPNDPQVAAKPWEESAEDIRRMLHHKSGWPPALEFPPTPVAPDKRDAPREGKSPTDADDPPGHVPLVNPGARPPECDGITDEELGRVACRGFYGFMPECEGKPLADDYDALNNWMAAAKAVRQAVEASVRAGPVPPVEFDELSLRGPDSGARLIGMENETKSVANGMGGEIEVPVYRPRVGESANDCAKRNGLRLLGRRESPTETTPVVGCVIDSGVTYRGVAK